MPSSDCIVRANALCVSLRIEREYALEPIVDFTSAAECSSAFVGPAIWQVERDGASAAAYLRGRRPDESKVRVKKFTESAVNSLPATCCLSTRGHICTALRCLDDVAIGTVGLSPCSVPVTVDLEQHLHLDFHLSSMVEMTLSANLRKATAEDMRLRWRVSNETSTPATTGGKALAPSAAFSSSPMTVTLKPREIKTYLLNAQPEDGE
jgi:hypothetical protein